MAVYEVQVRKDGRVATLPIVAETSREALLVAERQGTVLGEPLLKKEKRGSGMTPSERYVFLHQLATMNVAKVPLSQCLQILRESHGGRIGACAAQLEVGVLAGVQISDLMYKDKKNFPGAVGLLVKAGSKASGGTAQALKKAAEFEREIAGAATKGAKGVYSAAGWIAMATISLLACPMFLTPYLNESALFKMNKTPATWQWLDNLAWVTGGITGLLFIMGLVLFFIISVGQKAFPETSDKIIMKLPVVKDIIFTRDNFISLYRFALMVKAGVSLEEALDTTWADTRKGALKEDLYVAMNNVKIGKPWAAGFRTVHPTDKAALSMASDKERLGEILEQVADQNRAIYVRRLEVMQPIMKFVGAMSMVLVYAITGLYSIVPFSGMIEGLMSDAYSF